MILRQVSPNTHAMTQCWSNANVGFETGRSAHLKTRAGSRGCRLQTTRGPCFGLWQSHGRKNAHEMSQS